MTSFPEPFYRWRPHPWHGLETGPQPPEVVTAFIEISPRDVVKYEVDKRTGYIKLDRLQRGSSSPPTLYGLIPRTYCAERVAAFSPEVDVADGDPLDICVISERPIDRAEILITTRVLGGLRMIDGGEADDTIIAVVHQDPVWAGVDDLDDVPPSTVERLTHYFLTYKARPGMPQAVAVPEVYGRAHACAVIEASIADYQETFGE
jgi:inorganic pyrophosphatase